MHFSFDVCWFAVLVLVVLSRLSSAACMTAFLLKHADDDVLRFVFLFLGICLPFLCPFLATMSLDGYFLVLFIQSDFPVFFTDRVFALVWFDSVYLVNTAGIVMERLM